MDAKLDENKAVLKTADTVAVGTTFGDKYKILGKLGSGCISDVYQACELSNVRNVALKVIKLHEGVNSPALKLFEHNARLHLMHPNLVTMHACGLTEAGQPWLACELLQGATLAELLRTEGSITTKLAQSIFKQIFDAISYLHNHSEVHMNLKPSSIFLVAAESSKETNVGAALPELFVKIADVGIGKLNLEVELETVDERAPAKGSAFYLSPEQFKGEPIDPRTDVYALGCLLYECLVGRPPHQGIDLLETMDKHLNAPVQFPSEPEVSLPVQAVIKKCLEKDPGLRYRSVSDLNNDLECAFKGTMPKQEAVPEYVPVRSNSYRPPVGRKPPKKKGHEPWTLLLTAVTILLLVIIMQQSISVVQEINDRQARVDASKKSSAMPSYGLLGR